MLTITELPEEIQETLGQLVTKIKVLYPQSRILLFGSYARGNYNSESDIDIALFLPERCSPLEQRDIFRKICRILRNYCYDIQPQIFFEEEYLHPMGITEEIVGCSIDISDIFRHTVI